MQLLSAKEVQTLQPVFEMLHILRVEQITRYEAELQEATQQEPRSRVLAWISNDDYAATQRHCSSRRTPGTCQWFLELEEYKMWRLGSGSLLVVTGKRTPHMICCSNLR